jgi:hypothetical protein
MVKSGNRSLSLLLFGVEFFSDGDGKLLLGGVDEGLQGSDLELGKAQRFLKLFDRPGDMNDLPFGPVGVLFSGLLCSLISWGEALFENL